MAKLTITLTGRAPVTIDKEQWLVIASAADHEDASRGKDVTEANWKQWLTVRQHVDGRAIVYGVHDDIRPKESRRAGKLLGDGAGRIPELIPETVYRVAAYLQFDRGLADKCIANLPAVDVDQALPNPVTAFIESIARMTIAGDMIDHGLGEIIEYSPNGNDDEIDALYALIHQARELTGVLPSGYVSEALRELLAKQARGAESEPETDYACPECKDSTRLDITAMVSVRLIQNGPGEFETDSSEPDNGSHEWDGDSPVRCAACGWRGHMRDCAAASSEDKGATASSLDDLYRAAATEEYEREGEIEIDDNAVISYGDDNGAYVAAWVFVYGCALCKKPGGEHTLCDRCSAVVDVRAEQTGETPEEALEALKLARSLTNALSSALVEETPSGA